MCLTSGILSLSFDPSGGAALGLAGAISSGVVNEPAYLFGDALGELGDCLAVLGPHWFPKRDVDRRAPAARPVLAVRHSLGGADNCQGQARHISADAERCRAGLERSHVSSPGS